MALARHDGISRAFTEGLDCVLSLHELDSNANSAVGGSLGTTIDDEGSSDASA